MTCMRYALSTVYCLVFLFYWQRHPNALVIFSLKCIADFLNEGNPWWLTYKFIWKVIFYHIWRWNTSSVPLFSVWTPDVCDPVPETSHSTSEQTKLVPDTNFFMKNIGFHIVLRLYQTWQLWHAIKVGRKYLPGKKSELFAKRSWITVL